MNGNIVPLDWDFMCVALTQVMLYIAGSCKYFAMVSTMFAMFIIDISLVKDIL